jgi:hypothetical protein
LEKNRLPSAPAFYTLSRVFARVELQASLLAARELDMNLEY